MIFERFFTAGRKRRAAALVGIEARVLADARRTKQVLLNLVLNAVDAAADQGQVTVRVSAAEPLEVHDHGLRGGGRAMIQGEAGGRAKLAVLAVGIADYRDPGLGLDYADDDARAVALQPEVARLDGVRRTWYCGAYWRFGFHEDGVVSALNALQDFKDYSDAQSSLRRAG